jgi:hypothetical protein
VAEEQLGAGLFDFTLTHVELAPHRRASTVSDLGRLERNVLIAFPR